MILVRVEERPIDEERMSGNERSSGFRALLVEAPAAENVCWRTGDAATVNGQRHRHRRLRVAKPTGSWINGHSTSKMGWKTHIINPRLPHALPRRRPVQRQRIHDRCPALR